MLPHPSHKIYRAEFVSHIDGKYYFNIDLGFRIWSVQPIDEVTYGNKTFYPGVQTWLEITMVKEGRNRKYSAKVLG